MQSVRSNPSRSAAAHLRDASRGHSCKLPGEAAGAGTGTAAGEDQIFTMVHPPSGACASPGRLHHGLQPQRNHLPDLLEW